MKANTEILIQVEQIKPKFNSIWSKNQTALKTQKNISLRHLVKVLWTFADLEFVQNGKVANKLK